LEQEYKRKWLEFLDEYFRPGAKRVVFDQDVSKNEDAVRVVIPPSCSKKALEAALPRVREILKQKQPSR